MSCIGWAVCLSEGQITAIMALLFLAMAVVGCILIGDNIELEED